MKRFLLILTLPILACGGLAVSVSPTSTPLPPPQVASTFSAVTQPVAVSPTSPPTEMPPTVMPANATSFPDPANYEWRLMVSGLKRPVDIQPVNDGSGRLFIIEKYGVIRIYQNGHLLDQPFLDIRDRVNSDGNERGLLGLAFHPDYVHNGFFYVNYTGQGGTTYIARFHADGNSADPNSEEVLLNVQQPFANHNGGVVAFGPDGYLYLGLGDGGSGGDPFKNAQNTKVLLGKILRIDVNHGDPYSIPAGNPFDNEIWAYGLRNPWRISFDRLTGDLWIGDVGQAKWEEIDYLPAGSPGGTNFGWNIMEGNHGYNGQPQPGLLLPVVEYSHDYGCAVTGGYVYRGAMPEWNGIYFYGDYCSGTVWGLIHSNSGWQNQALFKTGELITSFGQDETGELYLASDKGSIYHLTKK